MTLDDALLTFAEESRELLEGMEEGLLALERNPQDPEPLGAIFRCAHTIKGSAGLFGLDEVVGFTHVLESVLDRLRQGSLQISPALMSLLLRSRDVLEAQVGDALGQSGGLAPASAAVQEALQEYLGADFSSGVAHATGDSLASGWHITFLPGRDSLRCGLDPVALLRYLATLGTLSGVQVHQGGLPPAEGFDPETCYLGFDLTLHGQITQAAVEEAFEFFRAEGASVTIEPLEGTHPAAAPLAGTGGSGTITAPTVRPADGGSIRIESAKLDHLISLMGELVISAAGAYMLAQRSSMREAIAELSGLIEQIRDSALQLRMVQIGATFSRFSRVVRDVSQQLGKDIRLEINGAETELDKTVVEKIGDPLLHLVRNSMDHGIEPAEVRLARGKPAQGRLRLNAYHESGSIVIEVEDDGAGLDRRRILNKAIEQGLAAPDQMLSDREVFKFIFAPGFSTASAISNLSGRGVGMDVVKQNIEALRGSIDLDSRPGEGTRTTIRLPLTLAIIDGFLIRVAEHVFVIPLDSVMECVELPRTLSRQRQAINLRGEMLPMVSLQETLAIPYQEGRTRGRGSVVVVRHAGLKAGIIVDDLLGEIQAVIKPLGSMFSHLRWLSGMTILGDGKVALILDVESLVRHVRDREGEARATDPGSLVA